MYYDAFTLKAKQVAFLHRQAILSKKPDINTVNKLICCLNELTRMRPTSNNTYIGDAILSESSKRVHFQKQANGGMWISLRESNKNKKAPTLPPITSKLSSRPSTLHEAKIVYECGNISYEGYKAFQSQFYSAQRRDIEFKITIQEWWKWWQTDDRWSRRGRGKDALVMARYSDIGPYSLDNIYCATGAQNMHDARANGRYASRFRTI